MGVKFLINKKFMILAIFLVSLLAVSAVNAADNITSDIVSINETDEVISIENNEECILEAYPGTFTDLANRITHTNNQLNLDRNYVYNEKTDSTYRYGIDITKKLKLMGMATQ